MSFLFNAARASFDILDRTVLSRLPEHVRARTFEIATDAKRSMFPNAARQATTEPIAEMVSRSGAARALPDWLVDEICALRREVDPNLFRGGLPKPAGYQRRYPAGHRTGDAYGAIAAMLVAMPRATHVVTVPWLKRGGADLVAIRTVEAILSGGGRPLVVTTEPATSPWASRLPPGVTLLELGPRLGDLKDSQKRVVLARLLLQFPPDTLHNINSRLAWETIAQYGRAITNQTRIFASLFCDDVIDNGGVPSGYAHQFVLRCDGAISGYVSDNRSYLTRLSALYGVDPAKCHTAFVPTVEKSEPPPAFGTPSVLWAGRLDTQKRPDLLLAVASAMPQVRFDVYGAPLLHSDDAALKGLRSLPNVSMMGGYDGFDTIPTERYGAFLYTSKWDGIPNVLLEAGMRRLPLVASDVGGIHELVGDRTGWLVDRPDDASAYVATLSAALSNAADARERAETARRLILDRHNPEAFSSAMRAVPGYIPPPVE